MTNLSFEELDFYFRNDELHKIENDIRGIRYFKLRSMSRKDTMIEFFSIFKIDYSIIKPKDFFSFLFELKTITDSDIDLFIKQKFQEERKVRVDNEEYLVDQLSRLQYFDWGGSFGNSLEKNIVDNYVKKIQSFEKINDEIEGSLFSSLKGYTLNSWYNHWTSIMIEDLFKDHPTVMPTIGLVKKIDFFINNIPFDLKVTYFPEQFLTEKLRSKGFGNELTKLKQICRELNILIPNDLKDKALKQHLYNKVNEDLRDEAKSFIYFLNQQKKEIIHEAEINPEELKIWLYENQGEARFDASNRFFLVLADETDLTNSWKLKRNIIFLRKKINTHLNTLSMNIERLNTEFYWAKRKQTFSCKSDILFIKQSK